MSVSEYGEKRDAATHDGVDTAAFFAETVIANQRL
jgi:hypothetical protein